MGLKIPTATLILIVGGSLILYGAFKILIDNEFMIPDRYDLLLPLICIWAGICLIAGLWTFRREAKKNAK
jgi:hypothetical protein